MSGDGGEHVERQAPLGVGDVATAALTFVPDALGKCGGVPWILLDRLLEDLTDDIGNPFVEGSRFPSLVRPVAREPPPPSSRRLWPGDFVRAQTPAVVIGEIPGSRSSGEKEALAVSEGEGAAGRSWRSAQSYETALALETPTGVA